MKHRLTVKIEKRFKKQLSKRFNPRNSGDGGYNINEINVSCILCDELRICESNKNKSSLTVNCKRCPFEKFESDNLFGCSVWLNEIMGLEYCETISLVKNRVYWRKENNKKAIELLKKLREKAKKYIVWI